MLDKRSAITIAGALALLTSMVACGTADTAPTSENGLTSTHDRQHGEQLAELPLHDRAGAGLLPRCRPPGRHRHRDLGAAADCRP